MAVFLFTLLFTALLACANTQVSIGNQDIKSSKNHSGVPAGVESRFFGLGGGIGGLINSLLPGFNLGNQDGPGRNPAGMGFPTNSQFYPNTPIQSQSPPFSSGQVSTWPVIDDASQFPNHANDGMQSQYPPQQMGGLPQYPSNGNLGGYPQYSQGNFGGTPQDPMYQQYPNQNNLGGNNPQYPSQGGFPNQPQYPGQGNFGYTFPPYVADDGSNPMQNQYPSEGSNWNGYPNDFGPGGGQGDGTLDSLVPPTNPQDPWNNDAPNDISPGDNNTQNDSNPEGPPFQNGSNGNAILGRPVVIPPGTTESGQISYPTSTENPSKRQCVQDCQTTSEYNPVCGSDRVTYINPGKFVCARNCGVNVFVLRRGRCENVPNPINVILSNVRP